MLSIDWQVVRRLSGYTKRYKRYIIIGMAASIASSALDAWLAWMIKPLVDRIIVGHLQAWWVSYLPAFVLLIAFGRAITRFAGDYFLALTGRHATLHVRQELFDKMLALPVAFFDANPTAQLATYHNYHVEKLSKVATTNVIGLFRDTVMAIFLIVVMVMISWRLSLLFFLSAPLVVWCVGKFGGRVYARSQDAQNLAKQLQEFLYERLGMQRLIRLHQAAKLFSQEHFERAQTLQDLEMKKVKNVSANSAIAQWILSIPLALAIGLLIFMRSAVSLGSFTAILLAMGRLMKPINSITTTIGTVQEGLSASKELFEVLDEPVEEEEGAVLDKVEGDIEYQNICFRYPNARKPLFKDLSLRISAGEAIALVGISGSGKTTLTDLLARFYPLQKGSILLDGHPIDQLSVHFLRSQISIVSQHVLLLNDTVEKNIRMGNQSVPFSKIKQVSQMAQCHAFIEKLPNGYQTKLGENGSSLSGGQRQRIALARCLLQDTPIIIFDEATSSLDNISEQAIQDVIFSMVPKKTILIISHRLSSIQRASRIVVLEHGKIVGEGEHSALLANNAYYQTLYHAQEHDHD